MSDAENATDAADVETLQQGDRATERVTFRLPDDLYADLQDAIDEGHHSQSQILRDGLRRELRARANDVDAADVGEIADRLDDAVGDVEQQVSRLERLPLK